MRPGWAGLGWLDVPRVVGLRRGRHIALTLLCVGLLSFAGCQGGDDPEPKFSESSDASSSAGGDPSSTATDDTSGDGSEGAEPVMPAKAKEKGFAGAKAFTKYYFEVLSWTMATGEVKTFQSLFTSGCETCRHIVDQTRRVYEDDGRYVTKGWEAEAVAKVTGYYPLRPVFGLRVRVHPYKKLDVSGKVLERTKGSTVPMRLIMEWHRGMWRVLDLAVIE